MKTYKLKSVKCATCEEFHQGKRQDKDARCKNCRKKYLQDYRKQPQNREKILGRYKRLKETVFLGYGGKCQCCKESRYEFLAIDHVNGGGRKERRTLSIQQIATKIVKRGFPAEYRILCHNCNLALGFHGYCPHSKWKRTA